MLHIHLFGHVRLLVDGRSYRFQGLPKTTPLLAYLLLHRETAVSRDHLAFLLWDDVPESEARANLRRHLHDLRRALPDGTNWVLSDAKSVQWNPAAPTWFDVAEFERLCQDTNRLTEAITLCTGDLLQSLYDDWILPERERLQALYFATLERLITREWERGDLAQAMVHARQLLSRDPLREDVLRSYMLLRAESGDRAGALQLYQQFKTRLDEELGVEPMPETVAVYDRVAHHQPPADDLDVQPRPVLAASPAPPAPGISQPPPNNLPARLNSFVGRQDELMLVCRLLGTAETAVRLLTITGPGGTGKTRLATEAAHWLWEHHRDQFPDGIYFVGLSGVASPELVLTAVAETLDLRGDPNGSSLENLQAFLRDKRLLLLLDNFEHLLDAAPLLVELLTAVPHLRLLVTSQAVLRLYGEHEFPLSPLPLPDPAHLPAAADLLNYAAVRLFVERLQAVQPRFVLTAENGTAVAEICRCLDGMPLALELAAARGKLFTPAAMLAQLNQRLHFLTGQVRNRPNRHQTLRATIDWSYNLLTPAEQTLFSAVALFAASFTLTAAEALFRADAVPHLPDIDIPDLILSLVDKNMLRALPAEGVEEPRFRMLQTLREYGLEKLGQMETAVFFYRNYAIYYTDFAEQGKAGMRSTDQSAWVQRLRQEENNMIAALDWLFADADTAQNALLLTRTITALSRFWPLQGRIRDLRQWLDRAMRYLPDLSPDLQAVLLNELGNTAQLQGDYPIAEESHRRALQLAYALDDGVLIAHTLHFLAYAAGRQGQYPEARQLFQESLSLHRQLPTATPLQLTTLLNNLAIVHKRLGEYDEAIALLHETLNVKRDIGDKLGLPASLSNLGNLYVLQGKLGEAEAHLREALELRKQLQDRQGMLYSVNQMASLAVAQARYGRAATLYAAADALHQAMGIARAADGLTDQQHEMEILRRQLDEGELATFQARGARMPLEEAVAYALREDAA
ncbi:MAG: tetratricopeptide repeat protein [Chloroflexota bacterium]